MEKLTGAKNSLVSVSLKPNLHILFYLQSSMLTLCGGTGKWTLHVFM